MARKITKNEGEIRGSYSGVAEDSSCLGCDTVSLGK
jgi:hypothetical protein